MRTWSEYRSSIWIDTGPFIDPVGSRCWQIMLPLESGGACSSCDCCSNDTTTAITNRVVIHGQGDGRIGYDGGCNCITDFFTTTKYGGVHDYPVVGCTCRSTWWRIGRCSGTCTTCIGPSAGSIRAGLPLIKQWPGATRCCHSHCGGTTDTLCDAGGLLRNDRQIVVDDRNHLGARAAISTSIGGYPGPRDNVLQRSANISGNIGVGDDRGR